MKWQFNTGKTQTLPPWGLNGWHCIISGCVFLDYTKSKGKHFLMESSNSKSVFCFVLLLFYFSHSSSITILFHASCRNDLVWYAICHYTIIKFNWFIWFLNYFLSESRLILSFSTLNATKVQHLSLLVIHLKQVLQYRTTLPQKKIPVG